MHRVIQRVPDESRCAAFFEVVHARGRGQKSQSVCLLCNCDDLVQAIKPSTLVDNRSPTPPWKICRAFRAGIPELRPAMGAIYPARPLADVLMARSLSLAPKQRLRLRLGTAGR